jgi:hypothetical protein
MKVAVCVSGIPKIRNKMGNISAYNRRLKEKFPNADIHYATWSQYEDTFKKHFPDEQNLHLFDEPEVSYHPYRIADDDCTCSFFKDRRKNYHPSNGQKWEWTKHHTKQILMHAYLMQELKGYDVIVRSRFDSVISKFAMFDKYVRSCYNDKKVHGFAVTRADRFNDFYDGSTLDANSKKYYYLIDQLLIHRYDKFDPEYVLSLDRDKKLHPAEWGWAQVLSLPYGMIHEEHHGWINNDRDVLTKYMMEHM